MADTMRATARALVRASNRRGLLFACGEIDHRGHPAVRRPLTHLQLFLGCPHVAETSEGILEHGTRVEVLDLLRSAGAVLQLPWRVALDDQKPARLERSPHSLPFAGALRG